MEEMSKGKSGALEPCHAGKTGSLPGQPWKKTSRTLGLGAVSTRPPTDYRSRVSSH